MEQEHKKRESNSSFITTTPTMRKKAEFVGKCFLNILKCLRFTKCTKSSQKNKKDAT